MLSVVVFDADETLLDLRPAVNAGLAGVLEEMRRLRPHFTLGYATNGNSRAERCGLAGEFAFERYAHDGGLPKKPAPGFYAAVVEAAGVPAEQIAYVGDSLAHDVVGPQRAGLRGIWLNRAGLPCPPEVRPDAEVSTLVDLPAVLRALQPANSG